MSNQHAALALTLSLSLLGSPAWAQCPPLERTVPVQLGSKFVSLSKTTLAGTTGFLGFEVIAAPRHGTLSDEGSVLRYTPRDDFWTVNADSFQIAILKGQPGHHGVPVRHLVELIATGQKTSEMTWDAETPDPPRTWTLGTNLQRTADASWDGSFLLRPTAPPEASSNGELLGHPTGDHGGGSQGTGGSSGWRPPGGGGGGSGLIGPDCEGPVLLAQTHPSAGASLLVHAVTEPGSAFLCLSAAGYGLATPWHGVTSGPHHVEMFHWRDPAGGGLHGAGLWVDGELVASLDLGVAEELDPSWHHAFAPLDLASGSINGDLDDLSVFQIGNGPRADCRGADTFETGAISGGWWANVPSNVTISAFASLDGDYGAAIQLGGSPSPGAFLGLPLPEVPRRLGARFRFDPNGMEMAPGSRAVLLTTPTRAGARAFRVFLDPAGSGYQMRIEALRDDGTFALSPPIPVTDAPHSVELDWQRSPSKPAGTGFHRLWLDGQLVARLEGLTNNGQEVIEVKIGAVIGVGSGWGTVAVDSLEVWEQK